MHIPLLSTHDSWGIFPEITTPRSKLQSLLQIGNVYHSTITLTEQIHIQHAIAESFATLKQNTSSSREEEAQLRQAIAVSKELFEEQEELRQAIDLSNKLFDEQEELRQAIALSKELFEEQEELRQAIDLSNKPSKDPEATRQTIAEPFEEQIKDEPEPQISDPPTSDDTDVEKSSQEPISTKTEELNDPLLHPKAVHQCKKKQRRRIPNLGAPQATLKVCQQGLIKKKRK